MIGSLRGFGQLINSSKRASLHRFFSTLPKHQELTMPALSPTMKSGKIAKWNFKVGDKVEAGDVLAEIETDKSNVGYELQEPGYVARILIPDAAQCEVGKPVAILVTKKDDVAKFANYTPGSGSTTASPTPAAAVPQAQATPQPAAASFPPHQVLNMPSLSPTMKDVGDKVSAGDTIAEIQTDKSAVGFEVQDDGYIAQILASAGGDPIDVGRPIAVVTRKQENVAAFQTFTASSAQPTPAAAPVQSAPVTPSAPQVSATSGSTPRQGDRVVATPLAKVIAGQKGVDLTAVQGSGPRGRIKAADVESFTPAAAAKPTGAKAAGAQAQTPAPAGSNYEDLPLSQMRKVIGQRLTESKQNLPHYYVTMEIKMDKLLALRKTINEDLKEKLSVNDFIIKAASLACKAVPEVNSQWHGDYIRRFHDVDVSFAVAIDSGLITPIVASADSKSITQIGADSKDLIARAKAGKLKPEEYQGGTFTISNLGMFGVKQFTAIINPPQACILAVGSTELQPVFSESAPGKVEFVNKMLVTLSSDHRVVDGAVASRWLNVFREHMENPMKILI